MRDLNSLFVSKAFRMRNRDLVYVSNALFTMIAEVLSILSTAAGPIFSAATTYCFVELLYNKF